MTDMVITQLRLLDDGLDLAEFEGKFGRPFGEVYGETVGQLKEWGLIREGGGRLLLTRQGIFLSNQVFYRFM
jgi:oxygen-independent coproporphyrinogen-3 oxidase